MSFDNSGSRSIIYDPGDGGFERGPAGQFLQSDSSFPIADNSTFKIRPLNYAFWLVISLQLDRRKERY